jgi:FkbM family methyltransferase
MRILYGGNQRYIDVTDKCMPSPFLYIPQTDYNRATLYGDPLVGVQKHIVFLDDYGNYAMLDHTQALLLHSDSNGKFNIHTPVTSDDIATMPDEYRLSYIQSKLKLSHGSFQDEYPEQLMATKFIKPDDVVFEIGGNIGRNSLIIASLISDSKNLTVVETDPASISRLTYNRDANHLNFRIVPAAISKLPMIQRGWDTRISDTVPDGWYRVNTASYADICSTMEKKPNVMVIDCEGALYYILQEESTFFDGINLVIMENDYKSIEHKEYVDQRLRDAGLKRIYVRPLHATYIICKENFYEVWAKDDRVE